MRSISDSLRGPRSLPDSVIQDEKVWLLCWSEMRASQMKKFKQIINRSPLSGAKTQKGAVWRMNRGCKEKGVGSQVFGRWNWLVWK